MLRIGIRVLRRQSRAIGRMTSDVQGARIAAAPLAGPSSEREAIARPNRTMAGTSAVASTSLQPSARASRPPRKDSKVSYPLTALHPPHDLERWPLLAHGTPECDAFAEKSKDGRMLAEARPLFDKTYTVLAISMPAKESASYRNHPSLKPTVLKLPRIKALVNDPDDRERRLLILNLDKLETAPADAQNFLTEEIDSGRLLLKTKDITVGYTYWSTDDVLSSLLPIGLPEGTPTAFTSTGHLAHLNLREEYAAYRFLIGQVILDQNAHLRTVVNKLDTIDNQFRFFKMERLAGDDDYNVTLSESGCTFTFDFRTVYWNSRLQGEHDRLINSFQPYEVISDVMAGVGPFAVPSAKKGAYVLANDLNPASYESLKKNAAKNRVENRLQSFCEDGRAFIRESIKRCWEALRPGRPLDEKDAEAELLQSTSKSRGKSEHDRLHPSKVPLGSAAKETSQIAREAPRRLIDHFVMNLPGSALEFLDAYRGAYKAIASPELEAEIASREEGMSSKKSCNAWPMVHVHCFTKDLLHPHEDICARANMALGIALDSKHALVAPPSPPPGSRSEHGRPSEALAQLSLSDEASRANASPSSPRAPTPELSLHLVRTVAPNKDMYCLSFRLTRAVLFDELK